MALRQALAGSPGGDLGSRVESKLVGYVLDVFLGGAGGELQALADLLIREALSDQRRDLRLPGGEGRVTVRASNPDKQPARSFLEESPAHPRRGVQARRYEPDAARFRTRPAASEKRCPRLAFAKAEERQRTLPLVHCNRGFV